MSYTIYFSDPAKFSYPITVVDNTIFNGVGSGGLTLVGKNYPGYGQYIAESFIKLLENFASPTPPVNPIEGQLWYDNDTKKLRINDGAANNANWKPVNGIFQQADEPSNVIVGDIWVDTASQQLKIWTGSAFRLVGPTEEGISETGSIPGTIVDIYDVSHKVIQQIVDGVVVEIITTEAFTPKESIFGFTTLDAGVNLSSTSLLNGTALNAQYLIQNGSPIAGNAFMRKDTNQTLNGQLSINQDANALRLGTGATITIGVANNGSQLLFSNNYQYYGNYSFNIKNADGATIEVLNISGNPTGNVVRVPANTQATSTVSGALQVVGGAGIGGNLYLGGSLNFTSPSQGLSVATITVTTTTNSTSTTTGGVILAGGLAVGQNIVVGGDLYITKKVFANNSTGTNGQVLVTTGAGVRWQDIGTGTFVAGTPVVVTGDIQVGSPTASTGTTTGALRVVGGVGIGGNLHVGGEIFATRLNIQQTTVTTTLIQTDDIIQTLNSTNATSVGTGALIIGGGASFNGNVWLNGTVNATGNAVFGGSFTATNSTVTTLFVTDTTPGSSTATGALIVRGGIGVGGNIYARNIFTNGHAVSTQTYVLNTATAATLGGVRIGSTVLIDGNAVININTATLMTTATYAQFITTTATIGSLGGVIIGEGIDINYQGVISLNTGTLVTKAVTAQFIEATATNTTLGGVRIGSNINVTSNGTISVDAPFVLNSATAATLGGVKIGNNINISATGTISVNTGAGYVLPVASTGSLGGVAQNPNGPTVVIEPFLGYVDVNFEYVPTKISLPLKSSYNTTATYANLDARIFTGGIPQIKGSYGTLNASWSAFQTVSATASSGNIVNTGTAISSSSWVAIGTPNNLLAVGDTTTALIGDQDTGLMFRVSFVKTTTASSGTVVIERLI